jgi:hypothetical protein
LCGLAAGLFAASFPNPHCRLPPVAVRSPDLCKMAWKRRAGNRCKQVALDRIEERSLVLLN